MAEPEWLDCTNSRRTLDFLRGKASDRKMRLFAVACSRRIWHLVVDPRCRRSVEVAEAFADGSANEAELKKAADEAFRTRRGDQLSGLIAYTSALAVTTPNFHVALPYEGAALAALQELPHEEQLERRRVERKNRLGLSVLVRCIFGNPFRPVALYLGWLTPTVKALAQAAYEERVLPSGELDLARLKILADALEEAGCSETAILDHLRGPGPHVRGCWVVDLLTGRA
jgi:hypothetical protein